MDKFPVNDPCPCGSGVKYKKCHGHPIVENRPSTPLIVFEPIKLIRQEHPEGCSIATAAMVAGTSYREAFAAIDIMSTSEESAAIYMPREGKFLNDRGWWVSAQLVLKTVVDLDTLDGLVARDAEISKAVENSHRLRLILAFRDGKKPDHSVIWDKDNKDVIYDPVSGVVPISQLLKLSGKQSYAGALGFMSFTFSPGKPIQALISQENG
jgi:SEC-C motif-containing protein